MLEQSITRPGWTTRDLRAYRHWQGQKYGQTVVVKGYYERTQGFARMQDFSELFKP